MRDKAAEAGRIVATVTAVNMGPEGGVKKFTPPTIGGVKARGESEIIQNV